VADQIQHPGNTQPRFEKPSLLASEFFCEQNNKLIALPQQPQLTLNWSVSPCQLAGCNTLPYVWPMNSKVEPVTQLTTWTCSYWTLNCSRENWTVRKKKWVG